MTDLETLDHLWTEAKSTQDIDRLAEIGNTFLDECKLYRQQVLPVEQLYLARVTWICGRMEFLRTARVAVARKERIKFLGEAKAPLTTNPYASNAGKFGPVRHEDRLVAATGETMPLDDSTRDLTEQAHAVMTQTCEPYWCGKAMDHTPHAVGDRHWCIGRPGLKDEVDTPEAWARDHQIDH